MKTKTKIAAMFVVAIGTVALVVPVAHAGSEPLKPGLSDFGLSVNLTSELGTVSILDARERAFGAKREAQLTGGQYLGVVDRAVAAKGPGRNPVGDDRFRIVPSNFPVPVSATSSGREIEWPQIGLGFGVGIVLMLGLYMALRATRHRQLAH